MPRAAIESISPCFIVTDVAATIAFYGDKLGFEIRYQEPDIDPFFAIVQRDGSMVFL
jgi:catechol 2,3-dioxygenase-like lactoylglutathione lyase family enzyme